MRHFAALILKFRYVLAPIVAGLVVVAVLAVPHLELDFSVFALIESTDEAKAEADEFYSYLPPRPTDAMVILEWPSAITQREVKSIDAFGKRLLAIDSVANVTSLANAYIIRTKLGVPLPTALPSIREDRPVRDIIGGQSLLAGRLISQDGHSAAVVLQREKTIEPDALAWIQRIRKETEIARPDGVVKTRIMASEIVEEALGQHMRHDMFQSILFEVICFLVFMPVLFRTVRATFIPLAVVACAVVFHLGVMVLFGMSLSLIEVAIPGLITIIALCDAIHMLHRFEESLAKGRDKRRAILEMMDGVGTACFYTSLTTAIGFLSLLVVDHRAIEDFAVCAATGVGIVFVCVVTLMPLFLGLAPIGGKSRGMREFGRIRYGRPALTYASFAFAGAVAIAGVAQISIGSRWLEEFPPGEPVVAELTWYQENFNGYLNLDVKLQGELDTIEAFRAIESLQDEVLAIDGVTGCESYTQWTREWIGNPEGDLSTALITGGLMYLKLSGATFGFPEHILTRDFRLGRIRFQMKDIGTDRVLGIIDRIEREAAELPAGTTAEVAGFNRMRHENARRIVVTMMKSLLVSTVSISIFIMIIYRSVLVGLLAAIPNLVPILIGLGLTGWLSIQLRIGIVMIYSLGVGLAVDNTIHLITRFVQERRRRPELPVTVHLQESLRTTGGALVASSAVLVLGSLCYLPSSFQSMSDVGVLLSTMVVAALFTEIWLLPHLLERFLSGNRFGLRFARWRLSTARQGAPGVEAEVAGRVSSGNDGAESKDETASPRNRTNDDP